MGLYTEIDKQYDSHYTAIQHSYKSITFFFHQPLTQYDVVMWDTLLCIGINFLGVDVNWIHKCPHILRVGIPDHPMTQISNVALGTKLGHHIFDSMLQFILK